MGKYGKLLQVGDVRGELQSAFVPLTLLRWPPAATAAAGLGIAGPGELVRSIACSPSAVVGVCGARAVRPESRGGCCGELRKVLQAFFNALQDVSRGIFPVWTQHSPDTRSLRRETLEAEHKHHGAFRGAASGGAVSATRPILQ